MLAARNTCFALISAIEEDFRDLIIALGDPEFHGEEILPSDVRDNAIKRRSIDQRLSSTSSIQVKEVELLPYIDFTDIAKILESKIIPRHSENRDWFKEAAKNITKLAPARNRVCHSRPLESEDFPNFVDFSEKLLHKNTPYSFPSVVSARQRLKDEPGFVLTLQIPSFWVDKSKVHHNLPIPEFDETGFLGRQTDRLNLLKLLKSHYPVITVVGEGGVGKTALALRCAYDLLDDPNNNFDAIIWTSLKTAALTQSGIINITNSITTTLGLLSEVAKNLGVNNQSDWNEESYIQEISEYLSLYNILIIIDNLETISTGPLRELLLQVKSNSKILITSRIGIGEFEARYPLHGLEEKASISLFRAFSKILGVSALQKLDDGNIKGYCKRLFYSPLLIKWFVAGVSRGSNPDSLINKDGESFSEALAFCFKNLFEKLEDRDRLLISCLACARKPLTSAEIHFLTPGVSTHEVELALIALHNSSIVIRNKKQNDGFEYSLSESTSAFITKNSPPSKELFQQIQNKLKELRQIISQENYFEDRYEFDPYFVRSGTGRDEIICATYLRKALDHAKRGEFELARIQINEAKRLASGSAEIFRISALIEENSGEHYLASQEYEHSIELDPKHKISRYCFGMFLMTDLEDSEAALDQFLEAERIDNTAEPILTAKAMALTRLSRYEESSLIHEDLLKTISQRERRWRLTGYDQAADSYRRWAQRCIDHKDYVNAEAKLKRSIAILLSAAEREDFDYKLIQRTAKVIGLSFSKIELSSDNEFIEYILTISERIHDLINGKNIPISKEMRWIFTNQLIKSDYKDRLRLLENKKENDFGYDGNSKIITTNTGRLVGEVHNIQSRFGFIICNDGSRWFFHIDSVSPDTQWEAIATGEKVFFDMGENFEGPCAVNVSLQS